MTCTLKREQVISYDPAPQSRLKTGHLLLPWLMLPFKRGVGLWLASIKWLVGVLCSS